MIIPKHSMPWLAASTDATRAVLQGAYYDKESHALRVTDGRMAAVIPVIEDADDEAGIIPAAALKEARKAAKRNTPFAINIRNGQAVAPFANGAAWPLVPMNKPPMVPFPDFNMIAPKFAPGHTRTARLLFNPYLLTKLCAAAGIEDSDRRSAPGVLIEFEMDGEDDAASKPILVTRPGAPCAASFLVFMPMKITSRAPNRVDDIEAAHLEYGAGKKEVA